MNLTGLIMLTAVMSFSLFFAWYVFAVTQKYFSIVDVIWAISFAFISAFILIFTESSPKVILLSSLYIVWGLRLGGHLALRLKADYPSEDARYAELKEKWSENLNFKFFVFFLFQALSVVILLMPLMLVTDAREGSLGLIEYIGLGIWIVGLVFESLADSQLKKFKSDQDNKSEVCNVGLWKYSRHPNYFFEWVIWIGYAVIAFNVPHGHWAVLCPLLMLIMITKITGIPYAEAQSLKTRGEKFKKYQETTSSFIPWFPKS